MKTLLKHGLGALAALCFSAAALAEDAAPLPVGDKDEFESRYIQCILSGLQDNCFIAVFAGRFFSSPGEGAKQIYDSIKAKMQGLRVRQVHTLGKEIKADLIDVRTYLLELDREQGFIGFYVVFRKGDDAWYVYEFAMDQSEDFIRALLGLPASPPAQR
ncbi:MAG: hypothetical protein LBR95_00150 [Azoarcus sp.]|jgi:hypothetical protein|nr:hypothetical protein [Azoarcus sp.]